MEKQSSYTIFTAQSTAHSVLQVCLRSKGTPPSPDSKAKAISIQQEGITLLQCMMALRCVTQV